ncbi:Mut7-C RNAse domain-containing protein [Zooshikella ganghwensis]|uniref:Mut7-C RNAse domain-containing protein n=1 Tax=Zooshikella ganghwensis TaxID=202772 RepID=UPI0004236A47|nr:Mut7-C RNAse domain-containing protein [Zooshikella ganghwensis]
MTKQLFIAPHTLKKQAKTLIHYWPQTIKTTRAYQLLCNLYGYSSLHQYQKQTKHVVINHYQSQENAEYIAEQFSSLANQLSHLGDISFADAKVVLYKIWPKYISNKTYSASPKEHQCTFFINGELTDFVQQPKINYAFDRFPAIKDSIEAIGIPHPEVGALYVNNQLQPFTYQLNNNDVITLYPVRDVLNQHQATNLPVKPISHPHFILDVHLGRLCNYLRMLGFDTLYWNHDLGDAKLAALAEKEQRIMLSRDLGLLKRSNIKFGRWLRNRKPLLQLKEVSTLYNLKQYIEPFSLCIRCNSKITSVDKTNVKHLVPADVYTSFTTFNQCSHCQQIYWHGSHVDKMKTIIHMLEY